MPWSREQNFLTHSIHGTIYETIVLYAFLWYKYLTGLPKIHVPQGDTTKLNRVPVITSTAVIAAGILSACNLSPTISDASSGNKVVDIPIVEAELSDGRYLDCITSVISYNHEVLDCNWNNPRESRDPTKQHLGPFTVFHKTLLDGRVLECIASKTALYKSVDSCNWN